MFVSVVIPCLNEAGAIELCVQRAIVGLNLIPAEGEIVVCDNISSDSSAIYATQAGARVVREDRRGYGLASLTGLNAADGDILVLADGDGSFDFATIGQLVRPIAEGQYDYVVGTRLRGRIEPGSMPALHRYVGTPVLNLVINLLFEANVSDINSGVRAMTRAAFLRMAPDAGGAELTSQFEIRARRLKLRRKEIPISHHRRIGDSKLRPIRDGFRHLRLILQERASDGAY